MTRENVARQTEELAHALTEGSRYHGYKDNDAKPSLEYKVADTFEFLEAGPLIPPIRGRTVPMTDYIAILNRVNIKKYVEEKDVKEVWLWGYRGGKAEGWESTWPAPTATSATAPALNDMPQLSKTYTLYHYNYQRGTSEATEDHIHQIEAVLNHVDGRDDTPPSQWSSLLFWGKFVGSDATTRSSTPAAAGRTIRPTPSRTTIGETNATSTPTSRTGSPTAPARSNG